MQAPPLLIAALLYNVNSQQPSAPSDLADIHVSNVYAETHDQLDPNHILAPHHNLVTDELQSEAHDQNAIEEQSGDDDRFSNEHNDVVDDHDVIDGVKERIIATADVAGGHHSMATEMYEEESSPDMARQFNPNGPIYYPIEGAYHPPETAEAMHSVQYPDYYQSENMHSCHNTLLIKTSGPPDAGTVRPWKIARDYQAFPPSSMFAKHCGVRFVFEHKTDDLRYREVVGIFSGIDNEKLVNACEEQADLLDGEGEPVHRGFKCMHTQELMGSELFAQDVADCVYAGTCLSNGSMWHTSVSEQRQYTAPFTPHSSLFCCCASDCHAELLMFNGAKPMSVFGSIRDVCEMNWRSWWLDQTKFDGVSEIITKGAAGCPVPVPTDQLPPVVPTQPVPWWKEILPLLLIPFLLLLALIVLFILLCIFCNSCMRDVFCCRLCGWQKDLCCCWCGCCYEDGVGPADASTTAGQGGTNTPLLPQPQQRGQCQQRGQQRETCYIPQQTHGPSAHPQHKHSPHDCGTRVAVTTTTQVPGKCTVASIP